MCDGDDDDNDDDNPVFLFIMKLVVSMASDSQGTL